MAGRRRKRSLNEAERDLWERVKRSVAPLPKPGVVSSADQAAAAGDSGRADAAPGPAAAPTGGKAAAKPARRPVPKPAPKPVEGKARPAGGPAGAKAGTPAPPATRPAPLPHHPGTLDGNLQRKLRRGRIEPDATIDLHGLTRTAARERLRVDLPRLRAGGCRCVIVITGKGSASALARHTLHGDTISHTPERRGVLREKLVEWLAAAEFRAHVAAVRPAHPRHGGGGAFYVWLRRQRS